MDLVAAIPRRRYLVAVSGGIDSVVLLDALATQKYDLVVAHVDHSMRPDSVVDARFVQGLAAKYGYKYTEKKLALGAAASEATARDRRYEFLRHEARARAAKIMTAHHADDVIESIALNITRGTGWRGLAVFGADDIERPLVRCTKNDIYKYALGHRLEWVEDTTNQSDRYLRNRLRKKLTQLGPKPSGQLLNLWEKQQQQKKLLYQEAEQFIDIELDRYFFTMLPDSTAVELLRINLERRGILVTRPHARRALSALKTGRIGTRWPIERGVELLITPRGAVVEFPPRVV